MFGAKPFSKPMLIYYQLDPWQQIWSNIDQNTAIFMEENALENVGCNMSAILFRPQYAAEMALRIIRHVHKSNTLFDKMGDV